MATYLGFAQPHKPFVRLTISGWIRKFLAISGLDMGAIKRHSTRSASISTAVPSGFSVSDILERGCWSNSSTW